MSKITNSSLKKEYTERFGRKRGLEFFKKNKKASEGLASDFVRTEYVEGLVKELGDNKEWSAMNAKLSYPNKLTEKEKKAAIISIEKLGNEIKAAYDKKLQANINKKDVI